MADTRTDTELLAELGPLHAVIADKLRTVPVRHCPGGTDDLISELTLAAALYCAKHVLPAAQPSIRDVMGPADGQQKLRLIAHLYANTTPLAEPADTSLRERAAAALYEHGNPGVAWADANPMDKALFMEDADAVLTALPTHADLAYEQRLREQHDRDVAELVRLRAAVERARTDGWIEALNSAAEQMRVGVAAAQIPMEVRPAVTAWLRRLAELRRKRAQKQQAEPEEPRP